MPQTRGELTPKQKQRIAAALLDIEKAAEERDASIASALKAGASVHRRVHRHVDLYHSEDRPRERLAD